MFDLVIKPAEYKDIPLIAADAREADRLELWDCSGFTPEDCMVYGLDNSQLAWTVWDGDTPIAMAGLVVVDVLCETATPWMLATHGIEAHPRAFLQASRKYLAAMKKRCDNLVNYVDARNTTAVRYLRWLGFTLYDPEPIGISNALFHKFELRGCHV